MGIKNVTHDKSITGKLEMNTRRDFAQNPAILSDFVPNRANINVKYPKIVNRNW